MKYIQTLIILLLALCFAACEKEGNGDDETPDGQAEILKGVIDEDRMLKDHGLAVDYIVEGELTITDGALVTVAPGVKIIFADEYGSIYVENDAGLKMIGTAEKPIVFDGKATNPGKGAWDRIGYYTTHPENKMEYVQLLNGGNQGEGALQLITGQLSMKNSLIDGSASYGIATAGGVENAVFTAFDGNTIKNCNDAPVFIDGLASVTNFTYNNSFAGNKNNYIYQWGNQPMEATVTLHRLTVPYYFDDGLYVTGQLTVEAGVMLLFNKDAHFEVNEGTLISQGTAELPVVIRGMADQAGYWAGVYIAYDSYENKLAYTEISGGGCSDYFGESQNLYLGPNVSIEIRNTKISKSSRYGIRIYDRQDLTLAHSNVTFSNCASGNVFEENYNGVPVNRVSVGL